MGIYGNGFLDFLGWCKGARALFWEALGRDGMGKDGIGFGWIGSGVCMYVPRYEMKKFEQMVQIKMLSICGIGTMLL